jgi:hypothetical protein
MRFGLAPKARPHLSPGCSPGCPRMRNPEGRSSDINDGHPIALLRHDIVLIRRNDCPLMEQNAPPFRRTLPNSRPPRQPLALTQRIRQQISVRPELTQPIPRRPPSSGRSVDRRRIRQHPQNELAAIPPPRSSNLPVIGRSTPLKVLRLKTELDGIEDRLHGPKLVEDRCQIGVGREERAARGHSDDCRRAGDSCRIRRNADPFGMTNKGRQTK